jgi:hypothetical protein
MRIMTAPMMRKRLSMLGPPGDVVFPEPGVVLGPLLAPSAISIASPAGGGAEEPCASMRC